jgi:hypothetical protein
MGSEGSAFALPQRQFLLRLQGHALFFLCVRIFLCARVVSDHPDQRHNDGQYDPNTRPAARPPAEERIVVCHGPESPF